MGRRKIEIQAIKDERVRRVTFKKRRIGLLKKAVQLSLLTNVVVEMKVYNKENGELSFKDFITVTPEIRQVELDFEQDDFILMASDGLFDKLSSQECV